MYLKLSYYIYPKPRDIHDYAEKFIRQTHKGK